VKRGNSITVTKSVQETRKNVPSMSLDGNIQIQTHRQLDRIFSASKGSKPWLSKHRSINSLDRSSKISKFEVSKGNILQDRNEETETEELQDQVERTLNAIKSKLKESSTLVMSHRSFASQNYEEESRGRLSKLKSVASSFVDPIEGYAKEIKHKEDRAKVNWQMKERSRPISEGSLSTRSKNGITLEMHMAAEVSLSNNSETRFDLPRHTYLLGTVKLTNRVLPGTVIITSSSHKLYTEIYFSKKTLLKTRKAEQTFVTKNFKIEDRGQPVDCLYFKLCARERMTGNIAFYFSSTDWAYYNDAFVKFRLEHPEFYRSCCLID